MCIQYSTVFMRFSGQLVPTGDIGQSAVIGALATTTNNGKFLGPLGMFGNTTAAPKIFTLADNNGGVPSYLTRAEIFAGIDGEHLVAV